MRIRTLPPHIMLDGPEATGTSTPPAEPAPATETPAAPPAADPAAPETPAAEVEKPDELPEWARKSLKKANDEAAAARVAAKQAKDEAAASQTSLIQSIGKALGLVKDDEQPTVESLTTSLQERDTNLTTAQSALNAQRAENAVLRFAGKYGADADALLDSRDFDKKLAAIDTASADYATQVEALVKTEAESNARYRTAQVAPKSSDGATPPAGGTPAPEGIDAMRKTYADRRGERA